MDSSTGLPSHRVWMIVDSSTCLVITNTIKLVSVASLLSTQNAALKTFYLRHYSNKIKYGDILERQSISVRNHKILVNSLIHIIQFELRFSVAPNILGKNSTLTFPANCGYTTLNPK